MSEAAIRKVWSVFALFSFSFSVYGFLRTRGLKLGDDTLGLFDLNPVELPLLAVPVDVLTFAVVLWLTHVWVRDIGGASWAERFPAPFFDRDDVDAKSHGGRVFQGWVLFLFLILPAGLILQMFFVGFLEGPAYLHPATGPGHPTAEAVNGLNQFQGAAGMGRVLQERFLPLRQRQFRSSIFPDHTLGIPRWRDRCSRLLGLRSVTHRRHSIDRQS